MKARIIASLAYPRSLISGDKDLDECRHDGQFSSRHRDCAVCAQGPECRWLYKHGEYAALEENSLHELRDILAFAIGFVDSWSRQRMHHISSICKCESCVWLHSARDLYDDVQEETAQTAR
jgi:hypothetical protein